MSATLVWALVLLAGAASAQTLGSVADIEKFPSLVQVEFYVGSTWTQQCAGSILTSAHFLSIARCFSGPDYSPESRRIRAGTSISGVGGQLVTVNSALLHPNFGLLGYDSDIAVVRLNSYLVWGNNVQQALILGQGIELPIGLTLQHAGWGFTAQGGQESNPDLYSLDLFVNENENCLLQYLMTPERPDITENMICVGLSFYSGRDFDPVDAGAPLLFDNTLVGILSFGGVTDNELPAVATAVGSYTQWIIDNAVI